jgi:hypothetical protein
MEMQMMSVALETKGLQTKPIGHTLRENNYAEPSEISTAKTAYAVRSAVRAPVMPELQ